MATGVQMNRTASGVVLPVAVSSEIWQGVQDQSVIQQVATRIPITGAGVTVPMITGDAAADWVAETDEKPVSRSTLNNKTVTPYKIALIVPFSNEFKRDLPTLYAALVNRLPNAIAKKFDATCLGYAASPGSGFDTLADCPTQAFSSTTVLSDVIAAAQQVVSVDDGNAVVTHTLASPQLDFVVAEAVDGFDRPLFPNPDSAYNRFGGTTVRNKHIYNSTLPTLGFVGDFTDYAVWGAVGGIEVAVSDQATITDGDTQINLWQRNMFALRVEAVLAFGLRDKDAFVRYVGEGSSV